LRHRTTCDNALLKAMSAYNCPAFGTSPSAAVPRNVVPDVPRVFTAARAVPGQGEFVFGSGHAVFEDYFFLYGFSVPAEALFVATPREVVVVADTSDRAAPKSSGAGCFSSNVAASLMNC
jgi:hypothetical protein